VKLPSLQRDCSWVWSEDPALDGPDYADAPKKNASEAAKKAWAARLKEWHRKLDVARDTGDYTAITKAGQALTLFDLRIIPEPLWRAALDLVRNHQAGAMEGNGIMVRLALRGVVNLDGFDGKPYVVELKTDDRWGQCAGNESIDLLAAYHRELQRQTDRPVSNPIDEMADFIIRRQGGVRPLSERG
jgi:hypothetical protein